MFDLIEESGKDLKKHGYRVRSTGKFGVSQAFLAIESEEKSREVGLAKGEYYIINSPFLHELQDENEIYLSKKIAKILREVLKEKNINKSDKILLACLGNPNIEGDRLGKEVFDRVEFSTFDKKPHLFKFCPNIYLFTGVETAEIIKMFVKFLKIKGVIIIDSLATTSLSRLGKSFQITTTGMTPGSGVTRFGKAISEADLDAKCISIGVPFLLSSQAVTKVEGEIFLVPKDVSEQVARVGKIIANALNEVMK